MSKKFLLFLIIFLIVFGFLIFNFREMERIEAVSTVGTSTSISATRDPYQRKSFYANGRFWVFYSDGTNLVYKTSTDSLTWSSSITARTAIDKGTVFSIWFDGTYLHYVFAPSTGEPNTNLSYRRGTPNTSGTITWSAAEQTVATASSKTYNPFVSVDSNGYVWIGYTEKVGNEYYPNVIKSGNKDGTWGTTPSGFPFQLSTASFANWKASVIPLTEGKMLAVYVYGLGPVKARRWTGSAWGTEKNTISTSSYAWSYSTVAEGDDVHLLMNTGPTGSAIIYTKYNYLSDIWGTETTIQELLPAGAYITTAPILSRDTVNNVLYAFWSNYPESSHIYYKKNVAGTWDSNPTDWVTETEEMFNFHLTSFYKDYEEKIGLIYLTGTSGPGPYTVKFAFLSLISSYNVSLWAWSEHIGWISFNCDNPELPAPRCTNNYGVNIDPLTGDFSGYAWSEHIGWITFNEADLSGCPVLPCRAWVDISCPVGQCPVYGWARVIAHDGDWPGGWIRLRDTNYGVWIDPSLTPAEFKGWAWSDLNIGWISFNHLNCDSNNDGVSDQGNYTQCPIGQTVSNYKVITTLSLSQPPSASILSVDSSSNGIICGRTSGARARFSWQFDDPGDTQSAYQIQVDDNSDFSSLLINTPKVNSNSQEFILDTPYPLLPWGGTYYWRLMVWDSLNVPSTDWIVYQNNTPPPEFFTTPAHAYPYPDFTPSPQNPAVNEVVTFNDNSKCYSAPGNFEDYCRDRAVTQYQWDFEDDGIIDDTAKGNTQTSYSTAGRYTVRLIITNDLGTCSTTRQLNFSFLLPQWREIAPF